jgi:hypothetical protein
MTLKQVYPPEYQWVQCAFKNSMIHNSAIHNTYRASLRSSSMREPRDPLLKVLKFKYFIQTNQMELKFGPC